MSFIFLGLEVNSLSKLILYLNNLIGKDGKILISLIIVFILFIIPEHFNDKYII